jgi:uncharacterized protein
MVRSPPVPASLNHPIVPSPSPRPLFSSSSFTGPLNFFPCPSSQNGVRCPRGSFVHAPYCRFHLRAVLNLDVKTSTIPDAGLGLFSLVSRPVGFNLVEYMGELLSAEETERRYPKNSSGTYCLKLTNSFFLDSALSRGVGSLANHPGKGTKPNVKFVVCTRKKSARLEVIEKVKAGDEIFVSYGDDYWKDAKNSTHFTVDVPDWEWDDSDPFAAPVSCPPTPCSAQPLAPPAVVVGNPAPPIGVRSPVADVVTSPQSVPASPARSPVAPDATSPRSRPVVVASPAHALAVLHASTPEVFDFTASDRPSRPSSCLSPGPAYNGPPLEDSNANTWPFSNCPDWPINNDWLRFAFAPVTFTVDEHAVESTSFSLKTILCLDNDSKT